MRQVVYGYHGTTAQAASAILAGGFRSSRSRFDWLGDGIYFWQDAPGRAWEWASKSKGYGEDAAVTGAQIEFDSDQCIDLLDIGWERALSRSYRALSALSADTGRPLPTQRALAHGLDRAVVNFLVQELAGQGVTVRVVRGAFREGRPVFPLSAFYTRSHAQIAALDPTVIVRRWRER